MARLVCEGRVYKPEQCAHLDMICVLHRTVRTFTNDLTLTHKTILGVSRWEKGSEQALGGLIYCPWRNPTFADTPLCHQAQNAPLNIMESDWRIGRHSLRSGCSLRLTGWLGNTFRFLPLFWPLPKRKKIIIVDPMFNILSDSSPPPNRGLN